MVADFTCKIGDTSNVEYKLSSLRWLCMRRRDGQWIPVFKLTDQQHRDLMECLPLELRR